MSRFHPRHLVLLLALVSLVVAAPTPTWATQPTSALPTLTDVSATSHEEGIIKVRGKAFSPGGQVYIALYDRWGATLHETRWVTSSATVYGRDGSADPAAGYHRGGTVREVFAHLCDATPMVRAYDQDTATWSNWLDVQPGC
jgi:hypothetical protein